jgi:hypothetical protein
MSVFNIPSVLDLSRRCTRLDHYWHGSGRLDAPTNITTGHVELVRELVHTYGADVNLVVENKDPKATPLVLALSLDRNVCRSVAQSLLEHGAQITTPSINVLNLPTVSISEIDLFATYNPDNFFYALRECSYSNWRMYDTPLTGAIRMGREEIAVQLLTHGAPSQVDFDLTTSVDLAAPRRNLPQTARDRFCQPFLLAAVKEMPRVMQALLERGADPTVTLTEEQARDFPGYTDCRTALDIVRKKLAELRSWEEERLPQHLSNADELLQRKKEAIFSLTRDYEDVEISLVQAGVLVSEGLNLATLPTSGPERVSHKRHKTVAIQENHPESEDTPTLGINNIKSIEEGHAAL